MGAFLRENWAWIVIPFLLVLGALLLFVYLGDGEAISPFDYPNTREKLPDENSGKEHGGYRRRYSVNSHGIPNQVEVVRRKRKALRKQTKLHQSVEDVGERHDAQPNSPKENESALECRESKALKHCNEFML
jgi:hypothetical protein